MVFSENRLPLLRIVLERRQGPVAQWSELAAHNRLVGGSSPPGPTILILCSCIFSALARVLANPTPRFATWCLRFALDQFLHRFMRKALSVSGSCVALHFGKCRVTSDRRNLVGAAPQLRKPASGCLPKSVGAKSLEKAGLIATISEPITEARC